MTPPQHHRRLLRWAECARLTYNWALSEWLRQYADHREALAALSDAASAPPTPSRNGVVHLFTVLREAGRLPSWAQEPLTRNRAGRDVDHAWRRNYIRGPRREAASEGLLGPPSLYLHNQSVRFDGRFAEVQKLGFLRLARVPRYPKRRVVCATITYEHGRWHLAIVRDLDRQRQQPPAGVLGVHAGVAAVTASDGATLRADVMTDAERRRLRRLERTLSRRGLDNPHGRMQARVGRRSAPARHPRQPAWPHAGLPGRALGRGGEAWAQWRPVGQWRSRLPARAWNHERATPESRKRIVRALLVEIVANVEGDRILLASQEREALASAAHSVIAVVRTGRRHVDEYGPLRNVRRPGRRQRACWPRREWRRLAAGCGCAVAARDRAGRICSGRRVIPQPRTTRALSSPGARRRPAPFLGEDECGRE